MPDFTVLVGILVGVEHGQEPQLSSDAEVGDDYVKDLVEKLIFGDLISEVLLVGICNKSGLVIVVVLELLGDLGQLQTELVETESLQVHDIPYVEREDPVVLIEILEA